MRSRPGGDSSTAKFFDDKGTPPLQHYRRCPVVEYVHEKARLYPGRLPAPRHVGFRIISPFKRGAPKGEGSSAQGGNQVPRDQGATSSTGISTCYCSVSNAELTYSNHFRYAPRPHRYLSHWQAGWTFSKWVCIAAFEAGSEQPGNSSPCTVNLSSLDVSFDFIHSPDTILIIFA